MLRSDFALKADGGWGVEVPDVDGAEGVLARMFAAS